jgi:hypothetical protein
MRKILFSLLIICFLATPCFSTKWFAGAGDTDFNAVSSGTTSSVWNDNADGTSGNYLDWSTQPTNGDIFIANGATIAIDDNIGTGAITVSLTTEGSDHGGTDGGGFTVDLGTYPNLTFYINVVGGSTTVLTVSGTMEAGETLTIIGNVTGGQGSSDKGIYSSHKVGAINITGNVTGGAISDCHGIHINDTGTASVTGNCIGSDTGSAYGCVASSSGALTVVGNIINGNRGTGVAGSIIWNPTAPANGVTGHYVKFDGGGTEVYAGKNTDDATKALTTFYYIDPTDGTSDQGSASSGGSGGGWAY